MLEQCAEPERGTSHCVKLYCLDVVSASGDFLEGFYLSDAPDFEEWIGKERAYWHRRMDAIFQRLSQMQFERGEIPDAIETTTGWIAHDPFNEMAYRFLMQAHVTAGDRTAALQTYDACRRILTREFNTRPAPETEALAERIRLKGIARSKLRPLSQEQSRATARIAPTLAVEPPLIGRGNEHNTLVTLYHTVRASGPQVVTLLGEAGIGKTRLATEFLSWATAQGVEVLAGRAFEAGGRLPYQPLVEALRSRLARENTPGDLLTAPWLAELCRLLPELCEHAPDLPFPSPDEVMARPRLFELLRVGFSRRRLGSGRSGFLVSRFALVPFALALLFLRLVLGCGFLAWWELARPRLWDEAS